MDMALYAILNKKISQVGSGISSITTDGMTMTFNYVDGGSDTVDIPDNFTDVVGARIDEDNKLYLEFSDGEEQLAGEIATIKGDNGTPCVIDSIVPVSNGKKIIFKWTDEDGEVSTTDLTVQNGTSPTVSTTTIGNTNYITITDDEGPHVVEVRNGRDGDGSTAESVGYEKDGFANIETVEDALNQILDKLYYVNPSCSLSASPAGGTYEIGTILNGATFTWTVNKTIVSQSLTDCEIELSDRSASYSSNISSNKTFTLRVNDGTNQATSSVSYSFQPRVYYGSATIPSEYNNDFVLGLSTSALKSSKSGTYSLTITGNDHYGFIAMPKSFANADVLVAKIGGFDTEIPRVATIEVTNSKGYKQNYNIFKTTNANLGSISATI